MATYYGRNSRKKENTSKLTGGSGKTYSSSGSTSTTSKTSSGSGSNIVQQKAQEMIQNASAQTGRSTSELNNAVNRVVSGTGNRTSSGSANTGPSRNTSSTVSNASAALANTGTMPYLSYDLPAQYDVGAVTDQQSALNMMRLGEQAWANTPAGSAQSFVRNWYANNNEKIANQWFPGSTKDDAGVWWYEGQRLLDMDFGSPSAGGSGTFTYDPNANRMAAIANKGANVDYVRRMNPNNLTVDSASNYANNLPPLVTSDPELYGTVQKMIINSQSWESADEKTRKEIHAKNRKLAESIPGAYVDNHGVWWLNGQKLYDMQYQAPVVEMPEFAYTPWEESSLYQQLSPELERMANNLANYRAFEYDPSTDPAYLQYADSYTRGGQRAMTDVLGQLAARTGGMASSYAGSMAQQTYDQYMTDLANKVPELRQLAYSMYVDDYNRQVENYNRAYNQYADAYGRWYDQTRFDYDRYQDELSNAWRNAEWQNTINQQNLDNYRSSLSWQAQQAQNAVENQRYEDETAYQREQDALNRQDYQNNLNQQARSELYDRVRYGYIPTQEDAARLGLSATELEQLQRWAREQNRQENSRYYAYYGY